MPEYRIAMWRGKWAIVYYRDGRRHRRSLGTADRESAERAAARFWSLLLQPAGHANTRWLWDAYCKEKAGKPVMRAMEHTVKALAGFMPMDPEAITVQHCRHHARMRRENGIGDGTIWTELGHLRTVLNWAEKRQLIGRAPYIELPRKPAPRDRHLTREEARRLIDAADFPHIKLYVRLGLSTAARNQAILDLTWDRVDFSRARIVLDAGKAGKRRATVPINETARTALEAAHAGRTSEYVIEWAGRKVGSVKKGFAAAARKAGLEDVSPHVLRHTAAVWMAEAGIPMHEISQYLGHSDVRTTMRIYARYSPEYLRTAAGALEI